MQYHKSHNSSGYQIQTGSGGSGGEGTLPRKSLPCLSPTLNQAVKDKKVLPSWKIEKKGVFTYLFYFLFSKSQREETSEPGLETASGFLELEWRRGGGKKRDGGHWKMPPDIGFDRAKEFVYLLKQRLGERLEEYWSRSVTGVSWIIRGWLWRKDQLVVIFNICFF